MKKMLKITIHCVKKVNYRKKQEVTDIIIIIIIEGQIKDFPHKTID